MNVVEIIGLICIFIFIICVYYTGKDLVNYLKSFSFNNIKPLIKSIIAIIIYMSGTFIFLVIIGIL